MTIDKRYIDGLRRAAEISERTERGKTAAYAIRVEIRKCQLINERDGIGGIFFRFARGLFAS